ncbi:MAG: hypothetical protein M9894_28830 [Planctomycetes bacterium]|nr:hypothetical protein [Planctomycetota bacterium]
MIPSDMVEERLVRPLEEAAREDPSFAEAHFKLGIAWIRAGQVPRAEAALRRADEVVREGGGPGHLRAVYVLARLAQARGDLAAARALLGEVVARDPQDPFAEVAAVYLEEDPEAAVRRAAAAARAHPYLGEVFAAYAQALSHAAAGTARQGLERLELLEQHLSRAIDLHQPPPEVQAVLLEAHFHRGVVRQYVAVARGAPLDAARADLDRARALLDVQPDSESTIRGQLELADARLHLEARRRGGAPGATEGARGALRRAIVADPRLLPARLALLELELAERRPGDAVDAMWNVDLAGAPPPLARSLRRRWVVAAVEHGQLEVAARELKADLEAPPGPRAEDAVEVPDLDARAAAAMGAVRRWLLERGRASEVEPIAREVRAMAAAKAQLAARRLEEERPDDAARLAGEGLHALDALEDAVPDLRLALLDVRAQASGALGRHADAARDLEAGLAINDRSTPALARRAAADACNLAAARARLPGGREAAIEALERAAALGWDEPDALRRHPALAPLLDDPRVQAALRRMAEGR